MTNLETIWGVNAKTILRISTGRNLIALITVIDEDQLFNTVIQDQNTLDGIIVDLEGVNQGYVADRTPYPECSKNGAITTIRFALLVVKRATIVGKDLNIPKRGQQRLKLCQEQLTP
jgi:hypothetical protein